MENKKSVFSRFRIVIRRSPLVLKFVVLATIVLSVAALTMIRLGIDQETQRGENARAQAALLEQQNAELAEKDSLKDTVEGVKTAAKENGYVDPDTILFEIVENEN